MAPAGDPPLALDPETMRRLGYRTIDMLVDRITGPAGPVVRAAIPTELRARLATAPLPQPHCFEGLGVIPEELDGANLAVAHGVHGSHLHATS